MKKNIFIGVLVVLVISFAIAGGVASNFTRIVLGDSNFGSDPNTTADITGQNDEYISNYTDGSWDIGSANIVTTGALDLSATTSKRDSFTTTAVKDTVVLTGLTSSYRLHVTQVTTLASATPDTGSQAYYAYFLNTDSAVVGRIVKNSTGSTLKSAGIYDILVVK